MKAPVLIVAGFARDLPQMSAAIPPGFEYVVVDEHTADAFELPKADVAVYVFSRLTGYSSHLLSWFTSIHHHSAPTQEFVLGVGDVDLPKTVFPFAKGFRPIIVEDLRRLLEAPGPPDPG